jgi:pimeloyl-ACP methyl ester carboxylesterase
MLKAIPREGIKLNYKADGTGDKVFIFIHNAGGNHQFMDHQYNHFSRQGYVVSIDLRGHGTSDKPVQDYSVTSFAEDILHIAERLSIPTAAVVGLNYGSAIAIEIANLNPKFSSHLVLVDPPILMEPWVEDLVKAHLEELKDPRKLSFAEDLVQSVLPKGSPEQKSMAINAFEAVSRQALISTYEHLLEWDKTSSLKLQKCSIPLLAIQSLRPFCSEGALKAHCSHMKVEKVASAGPWATLEVPEEVNEMIENFTLTTMQNP